jgi:hypothetical protein
MANKTLRRVSGCPLEVSVAADPQGIRAFESLETSVVGTVSPRGILVPHELLAVTALALAGADEVVGEWGACITQKVGFLGQDGRAKKAKKAGKKREGKRQKSWTRETS